MNEINSNNKQADDSRQHQNHHHSPTVCSKLISKENHDENVSSNSAASSLTNIQNNNNNKSNINSISSFILTSSQALESSALNLREILQLFNCAISQEQAWAVLYQTLNGLKYLFTNNLDLIKSNVDNITINLLYLNKDGSVLFCFNTNESGVVSMSDVSLEQEKTALETKALKAVAYLIFDALDYGNNYHNEPVLNITLSHLLLQISGHYKAYTNKAVSEDDEGYEQEEEESIGLEKALEACINNISEAEKHYQGVCRGLYAQAYELKAFLAKIEDSKNVLQNSGEDTKNHYCFEVLDTKDWANLWMQVIHELRNGVKLRKVCDIADIYDRRHIEYELTPFEILLDQIRARRYHLKKVTRQPSLGPEIKKDARDIILDFIRSRPPLKKSSLRMIKTAKQQPLNAHEQLMISIRNFSSPLLRKTDLDYDKMSSFNKNKMYMNNNDINANINDINGSPATQQKKRLLKADKKLLNNLTSSDDEESDIDYDELKNLPALQEELTSDSIYSRNNATLNEIIMNMSTNNYTGHQRKRRIKPPESLKSPLAPWREPVEDWKALVTEDVFDEENKFENMRNKSSHNSKMPNRRHTMTLSDIKSFSNNIKSLNIFSGFSSALGGGENIARKKQNKVSDNLKVVQSRLTTPVYLKSGPGYDDFGFVSTQELIKKLKSDSDCLNLTFEELCHIRNVLTKAELDYLLFDDQLFQDVSKGKVCFSCRKTKFNLFNWGCKCRICQQKVCKKCLRNAQLKNGQIAQVPLFKLCPNKFETQQKENNDEETYLKSYNSNSSISSGHSTAEDNTSNNRVIIEDEELEEEEDDETNIDRISSSSSSASESSSSSKPRPPLKDKKQNEFLLMNKFQSSLKENIFKSEDTNTVSSSDGEIVKQNQDIIILEICADCYQMMEGVTVDDAQKNKEQKQETQSNGTTSTSTSSSTSSTLEKHHQPKKVSNQKNFIKSIYMSKNAIQSMPSSCSSDAIVMNSLSSVNIVNSVLPPDIIINNSHNDDLNNRDSPLLIKKSFGQLQSHSTPSTSTSNLGGILNKQPETELSQIVLNDENESMFSKKSSNIKVTREKLTLNLQPVYTSASSSTSS